MSKEEHLTQLANLRRQRVKVAEQLRQLDALRAELIVECFRTGETGATTLARVTGMSPNGVYKIRDRTLGTPKPPRRKEGDARQPHANGPQQPASA